MQNKIIVFILGAIVAVGIVFFAVNQKSVAPDTAIPEKEQEIKNQNQPAGNNFSGTILDLMNKSQSSKCVAKFDMDDQTHEQTIYFDGQNKKIRFEIEMNVDGRQNNVFAIVKDGWEYMWNEGDLSEMGNMGMKLKFDDLQQANQNDETDSAAQTGGVDIDQIMQFSCSPWVVDSSAFDSPANIEFTDITAQTQQFIEAAPQDACEICDMMPSEDLKAQCRQANCAE